MLQSFLSLGKGEMKRGFMNNQSIISENPMNPHLTSPLGKERNCLFIF